MLTRVRNALRAKHQKVDVPASKLKMEIARILKEEGYIVNFKLAEDGTQRSIRLYLKYTPTNEPAIVNIERVSRPGCRVYVGSGEIPRGTAGWVKTDEVMAFINATLTKSPYILGDRFSAVDILVATTFKMFMGSPLLEKTALLESYVNRVTSRPAYARAQAKEND